jgi:cation diffusion facilitator CzcD-associated flavoprotein CzcO
MSVALDVLIVGAGLSGVGVARHLERRRPWARQSIGGAFAIPASKTAAC